MCSCTTPLPQHYTHKLHSAFSHRAAGVDWMSGKSSFVRQKCPTKFTPKTRSRPSAVTRGPSVIPTPAVFAKLGGGGGAEREEVGGTKGWVRFSSRLCFRCI